MLPRQVEVDIGPQRRSRRVSCRQAIELGRCLVEHPRHGGDHQIVLGREMGIEPAMREPSLPHHGGDAHAMRALRPYRFRSFFEDPSPGPLLVFRIIPHGPPLYDYRNPIVWPLQALTVELEQTSVSKG